MTGAALDQLDARIIRLFSEQPHIGVLAASRTLGVARGTVQARLDRLVERGVIASQAPLLSPAAMGYAVTAFVTLQIRQHVGSDELTRQLGLVPEVLEAHTITGDGDVLVRIVARDHTDLQRVLDRVTSVPMVERSSSVVALVTTIPWRTGPLLQRAVAEAAGQPSH